MVPCGTDVEQSRTQRLHNRRIFGVGRHEELDRDEDIQILDDGVLHSGLNAGDVFHNALKSLHKRTRLSDWSSTPAHLRMRNPSASAS